MGKHRRQRQKLHLTASPDKPVETQQPETYDSIPINLKPDDNIFKNIDDNLFKNINFKASLASDDTRSMKSFKSLKSEKSGGKALTKKEKLKLRKEFLLKKIDTVVQMKKEAKLRNKRKNTAILGDTNPLHDALPSLESLLKSRTVVATPRVVKPKGIQKASRRKRDHILGVQLFKQILSNDKFKSNPLAIVSGHIKAFVEKDKQKQKI